MSLATGSKLLHYDIVGPLGAGAMGEVYRARDTRLDREVAIKVLPELFAKDQERLQRFAREAKALAAFDHPNVAHIHGIDQSGDTCFLVLELVPGETLAERLSRGALGVEEALEVCVQIASGLEAAHDAGVIHRDLKPGNVKLTPEGKVKVLDFGLARQGSTRERPSSVAGPLTEAGVLLGTPGYMSPEQLRGKPIDRRSDVFAFGCVLYACLVGEAAFPGETPSDVIAASLENEPDIERLPPRVPGRVRDLIAKCLEKDLRHRLRDIGDARIELERAIANKEWSTARLRTISGRSGGWRVLGRWLPAGVIGAAVALAVVRFAAPGAQPSEAETPAVSRLVVNPYRLAAVSEFDTTSTLAISPDGARIAFLAREKGSGASPQLYLRELSGLEATLVPGSQNAHDPFFSPDGEWLCFADDRLWKVPVAGGPRLELTRLSGFHKGSTWYADGILTSPAANTGLFRVPAAGGRLEPVTELDASKGETSHRWPEMLPDGRHVLYTVKTTGMASFDDAEIAVYSSDDRSWKTVLRGGYFARYAHTGQLLYVREGAIMAAPFDTQRLEVTGTAVRVVPGVMCEPSSGAAQFAVSRDGTLVYAPGGPVENLYDFLWLDRRGEESPVGLPARPARELALSPDGGRVAMVSPGATDAVFVYDLARGTLTRATFEGNCLPVAWTPDGADLVYASDREPGGVFRSRADGSGTPSMLFPSADFRGFAGLCFVGSTSTLVFPKGEYGERDIWSWSPEQGAAPLISSPLDQWNSQVSPDGKWIAYASDESGRAEIYVRPFPSGTGRWQISKDGAERAEWSADSRELYFIHGTASAETNGQRSVSVVSIASPDGLAVGLPEQVFEWNGTTYYSMTPDRQRVLFSRRRDPPVRTSDIHAVIGWHAELRRLAQRKAR